MKYFLLLLFLVLVACSNEKIEISAVTIETENM